MGRRIISNQSFSAEVRAALQRKSERLQERKSELLCSDTRERLQERLQSCSAAQSERLQERKSELLCSDTRE
ncbi:MAG: hypothetical protein IJA16_03090, partial [Clostridia bacterium]|nr:hypothetical protein [Clostridia bacterium]